MPTDIQRLRDAAELWRTEHKRLDDRWSLLAASMESTANKGDLAALSHQADLERQALAVAIKAIDLCISRRVVPRLVCPDAFVTEVVIPPKPRSVESESTIELSRHSHGPVVVECEYGCASAHAAYDLVDEAQRASIFTRGWAPLYVRLWVELLRHHERCSSLAKMEETENERTIVVSPPKHEGPRLVVAPEQDEPS
jgi:hypothetical protein